MGNLSIKGNLPIEAKGFASSWNCNGIHPSLYSFVHIFTVQEFQIKSYFLTYMVLRNRKLSSNVFPYWWDNLYKLLPIWNIAKLRVLTICGSNASRLEAQAGFSECKRIYILGDLALELASYCE